MMECVIYSWLIIEMDVVVIEDNLPKVIPKMQWFFIVFSGSDLTSYGEKFESVSLQMFYKSVEILSEASLQIWQFGGQFTWRIMKVIVLEKVWI